MNCREIFEKLNEIMPVSLAMDFDNSGFLVGRNDKEVKKILLALDATSEVVSYAITEKGDLIITHHPLIFTGLKKIVDTDITGKRLLRLIENKISLISMHTNYDIAYNCMADKTAKLLDISGEVLEKTNELELENETKDLGIGKVGKLSRSLSLRALVELVKDKFELDFVRVYGSELLQNTLIERVAISPGSGKGMYKEALKKNTQVLITGDITHHEGIDAREAGICIIDAGHYGIEHIFIEDMFEKLTDMLPDEIKIMKFRKDIPDIVM